MPVSTLESAKERGKKLKPFREKAELYLEKNPGAKARDLALLLPDVALGTLQTWRTRFQQRQAGLTTKGEPRKHKRRKKEPTLEMTLEMATDILIQAMQALKELPAVKAERDKYKRGYNNALDAIEGLKEDLKKVRDSKNQFRLSQQNG